MVSVLRPVVLIAAALAGTHAAPAADDAFLAQGTMSGEVTESAALLQTRLTSRPDLDDAGDIPGAEGWVSFAWGLQPDLSDARTTAWLPASDDRDFIVRVPLDGLEPDQRYYFRAVYGVTQDETEPGPICSFQTLPGKASDTAVRFVMGSCMNYNKFMHGKAANASGPVTATDEDKQLGFPSFAAINELQPDFFIGTGDIVYYDNKVNNAKTLPQLRRCWHQQMRFPRLIDVFANAPAYWSKDDHDFRFNDADRVGDRLPLPATGIELFREQLPILPAGDHDSPTYRTHRVNKDLQLWFSEGRDYRSPNKMDDGPGKTLWGDAQRRWLQETLQQSDARWKILISPTPMVGPDGDLKTDNHTNLGGFRHEADEFFTWLNEQGIENFLVFCGDRHWQYHSIHPSGVEEFGCGALNDENSRRGVAPGSKQGTDPNGLIKQPYTYAEPTGGFMQVKVADDLTIQFYDDHGTLLHEVVK